MTYKEFRAGKTALFSMAGSVIFAIGAIGVLFFYVDWLLLLPPIMLSIVGIFKIYRLIKRPLLIISENEIVVSNPPFFVPSKKIATDEIVSVKQEGKNKLELFVKGDIPEALFLYYLSRKDRKDLKVSIESIVSKKNL